MLQTIIYANHIDVDSPIYQGSPVKILFLPEAFFSMTLCTSQCYGNACGTIRIMYDMQADSILITIAQDQRGIFFLFLDK